MPCKLDCKLSGIWTFLLVVHSVNCFESYRNKTQCWPKPFTDEDILCPQAGTMIKIESLAIGVPLSSDEPCSINWAKVCTHRLSKKDSEELKYYDYYSNNCDGRQSCKHALKEYRKHVVCDQGDTFQANSLTIYYRCVTGKTQCETSPDQSIACKPGEFIHIADILEISRDDDLSCPSNKDLQENSHIWDRMHHCERYSLQNNIKRQCNMVNKCNLSPLHFNDAGYCKGPDNGKVVNTLWVRYTCSEVYSSTVVMLPLAREMNTADHSLHLLSDGFPQNMPQKSDMDYSCFFQPKINSLAFIQFHIWYWASVHSDCIGEKLNITNGYDGKPTSVFYNGCGTGKVIEDVETVSMTVKDYVIFSYKRSPIRSSYPSKFWVQMTSTKPLTIRCYITNGLNTNGLPIDTTIRDLSPDQQTQSSIGHITESQEFVEPVKKNTTYNEHLHEKQNATLGGILGGLAGLILIIIIVTVLLCCIHRLKNKKPQNTLENAATVNQFQSLPNNIKPQTSEYKNSKNLNNIPGMCTQGRHDKNTMLNTYDNVNVIHSTAGILRDADTQLGDNKFVGNMYAKVDKSVDKQHSEGNNDINLEIIEGEVIMCENTDLYSN